MAVVSRVSNVVSKHKELEWDHVAGRRRIGSFFESIGKYAVDFSVNLTTKGRKGFMQLHKTVQELKVGAPLNECNDQEKQKPDALLKSENEVSKMEKMQEEMTLKNGISTEKLEPISSKKFPPKQVEEKEILNPSRKKIMIRSRL